MSKPTIHVNGVDNLDVFDYEGGRTFGEPPSWRVSPRCSLAAITAKVTRPSDRDDSSDGTARLSRFLCAVVGILLLLFICLWLVGRYEPVYIYYYTDKIASMDFHSPSVNTVRLEVYIESQCPTTTDFLHNQLTKTWSLLSSTSRIELAVIPFGKARCVAKGDDFECTCQHGAAECSLNQLMNCVIDRLPNPDKYLPVIDCIQGRGDLNEAMTSCLNSSALLDSKEIYACATGPSGRRLLAEAGEKTEMLKPPLDSVPWVVIDGDPSSDAASDLTNVLCRKLKPSPEACTEVLQGRNA